MRERRSFLALVFAREAVGVAALSFILFLIGGPPGLWNMPALYRDAARLERDGAETFANVMALEKTTGENPRHLVSYAFMANGTWFEGQTEVPEDMFERLQVEDRVPIRYWSEDPALAEIEPDMSASEFWAGHDPSRPDLLCLSCRSCCTASGMPSASGGSFAMACRWRRKSWNSSQPPRTTNHWPGRHDGSAPVDEPA